MKKNIKKFLSIILVIVLIISIIYIVNYIRTITKDKSDLKQIQSIMNVEKIQDNDNTSVADENVNNNVKVNLIEGFKTVQSENSNIVAWITIEDTNINYPILQGKDNDYYLDKNYKNEYTVNGSIFLDYRYDFSKDNMNFFVYGHNNNDQMMFNDLIKYKDKEFFDNHKTVRIITSTDIIDYEIFSIFKSQVYTQDDVNVFRYYNYIDLSNEKTYEQYVSNCVNSSMYDIDIKPEYGDKIITLSTCEYSKPNGRFVVVAMKKNIEEN